MKKIMVKATQTNRLKTMATGDQAIADFSDRLLAWYDEFGRRHLPWQQTDDPYCIWLSEIMLQQTQVATVIPYYEKFLEVFPTVQMLAQASQDQVLHLWSGLGYYTRGRNLHAAAKMIESKYAGVFPKHVDDLQQLPGVGRSTAAAIAAQAFAQPNAILDGNVKRSLARLYGIDQWTGSVKTQQHLWAIAEANLPNIRSRDYCQASMDFGATLCKRSNPDCDNCPFKQDCVANQKCLQAQLPVSKPKKKKPIKKRLFLVLKQVDNHSAEPQYLLQKQAASGIWGGLWAFPSWLLEDDCSLNDSAKINLKSVEISAHLTQLALAVAPQSWRWTSSRRHTFTHYHLDYVCVHIDVTADKPNQMVEAAEQLWWSAGTESKNMVDSYLPTQAVGVPALVAKIVAALG